jgi:hypothetical protein
MYTHVSKCKTDKKKKLASHTWFTPVILATQEAEFRRMAGQSQPRPTVGENLS